MAIHKGIGIQQYLDIWLVRATSHQACLQHTEDLLKICQIRLAGEFRKIRTVTKAGLRECKLPVRPQGRSGPTDTGPLTEPSGQNTRNTVTSGLSGPAVHVSDGFTNSHRKAGSPRPTSYETHTVASQKQLEGTRVTRKGDSNTKVLAPTFTMVTARGQCPYRPTITPNKTCSANLYRCIKRRVGHSLKRMHCKRHLVPSGKQIAYQLPRIQGSLSILKRVRRPLQCIHNIVLVATAHVNKEGGMRLGPLVLYYGESWPGAPEIK